jgi:hypothetical protein
VSEPVAQPIDAPAPCRTTYQAAAALHCVHSEPAVATLHGQLRLMAVAAGATPDWSTFAFQGPIESRGMQGALFEWRATVVVDGGEEISDDAVDAAIWAASQAIETGAAEETMPLPRAV